MFLFKKIVGNLLMPYSILIMLFGIGLYLLWFGKGKHRAKIVLTSCFFAFLVISFPPLPTALVGHWEGQYPTYDTSVLSTPPEWVIVLGGGVYEEIHLPPHNRVPKSALSRLVEGIRLLQVYPEARLLLTASEKESLVLQAIAVQFGIDVDRIVLDLASRDTKDHALFARQYVGSSSFLLVTSAIHMPRAMALFKKQGLNPIPAPTDHLARTSNQLHPGLFFPSPEYLIHLQSLLHEYLGQAWAKLRGQI